MLHRIAVQPDFVQRLWPLNLKKGAILLLLLNEMNVTHRAGM
jgi:hypothetical protein